MQRQTAVTIGNFDGVHLGHQSLIRSARRAVGHDGQVVVLAFDPHPATVLAPDRIVERLSDFSHRTRWLVEAGADEVLRLEPTAELLGQSPERFVSGVVERFQPTAWLEGHDFRFGQGRAGSMETLARLGRSQGFQVIAVDAVETMLSDHSVVRVSSTLVRWLVAHGRVRDAGKLLGRPYSVAGEVVPGVQRGREIGIPTANLDTRDLLLPADGVYVGEAWVKSLTPHPSPKWGGELTVQPKSAAVFRAAISVGTNPTFSKGEQRTCEAHLLDFDGPCGEYHWTMELLFHDWLRDQAAFTALHPLIDQIHRDIRRVREWTPALECAL